MHIVHTIIHHGLPRLSFEKKELGKDDVWHTLYAHVKYAYIYILPIYSIYTAITLKYDILSP